MGSLEATSATDPRSVVATAGTTAQKTARALKQIRKAKVMIVAQPVARAQPSRSHLAGFQAENDVGSETVHQVSGIGPVPADAGELQIPIAVVLLTTKEVEGQAGGRHGTPFESSARR